MRRTVDISAPLRPELVTWPGVVESFERHRVLDHAHGDGMAVSTLQIGAHAGTHIDAPNHFIPSAGGIETIPVAHLMGPAQVVEIPVEVRIIDADRLESGHVPEDVTRILFKTSNSGWSKGNGGFDEGYVACDESAAEWLLARDVVLVGIDYLSIEPYDADVSGFPVHRALLESGVVIVESLDLADVEAGRYELVVLPLLIPGSDGAPARAILVQEE